MRTYVDILGTRYTIESHKRQDDADLNQSDGYCNDFIHKIVVIDAEDPSFSAWTAPERASLIKNILRHEIIHAFLSESGLKTNANPTVESWARNEEMIDFFAIQFPKLLEAFRWCDCL